MGVSRQVQEQECAREDGSRGSRTRLQQLARLQAGDIVKIMSASAGGVITAEVKELLCEDRIRVEYMVDGDLCTKSMYKHSKQLVGLESRAGDTSKIPTKASRSFDPEENECTVTLHSRCSAGGISKRTHFGDTQDMDAPVVQGYPVAQKISAIQQSRSMSMRGGGGGSIRGTVSEETEAEALLHLRQVPLFRSLTNEQLLTLASVCKTVVFQPGTQIIQQGEDGDEFFIVLDGVASVTIDGHDIAEVQAGDFFGEVALIKDVTRTATITAESKLEALMITRSAFTRLGLHDKLSFTRRPAVAAGSAEEVMMEKPTRKTSSERELIAKALRKNHFLAEMVSLDAAAIREMTDRMWEKEVPAGEAVIQQGDLHGHYFYVVQDGSFEVVVRSAGNCCLEGVGRASQMHIGRGSSFGELALMYAAPRAATVTAQVDSKVWVIDRIQFKEILMTGQAAVYAEYLGYLNRSQPLSSLTIEEKQALTRALVEKSFDKGELILQQGDFGDFMYILVEGEVSVIQDNRQVAKLSATPDYVHLFGEMALLNKERRLATIKVLSHSARTLAVDKESFDLLLGERLHGTASYSKMSRMSERVTKAATAELRRSTRRSAVVIKRTDLRSLGLLGCGGFGAVELVEHVPSQNLYALKALSKGYVMKCGMQSSVMAEKSIQMMCDSDFVVKLHETYNGDQSLFFLLELAVGGEVFAAYNKKNLWGRVDCARYYVAGAVFAFEHFHSKRIVYRDLKPENMVLTDKGHVKVTDLGLAKVIVGKTYTTCGTPDYFAPEIIEARGHTHAVDWWTLAVLTYELLSGCTPFQAKTPMEIYKKARQGFGQARWTSRVDTAAKAFIQSVGQIDPSQRLPMKTGGISNIQTHAWFQGFDWRAMFELQLQAPYMPPAVDKSNFKPSKQKLPPQLPYTDDGSGWDANFATA
eukprot:TRINITY_DN8841_c0_g1_i1.p1 TRINITY_DN8841_c0_g1~~TRINITY_DN8841_c0_g1_i1.p1  ORF type:complete len:926 (-),score=212.56 TRINITY_DN8841_c0_g1_i1:224-3001(-)